MSDIDTKLEALAAAAEKHEHVHGRGPRPGERRPATCASCDAVRVLEDAGFGRVLIEGRPTFPAAAALLRARKALRGKWCIWDRGLCPDNVPESEWCPRCIALNDTELEKAL